MKTVIEMAREAEFPAANYPALVSDGEWEALERFAELVRADALAEQPAPVPCPYCECVERGQHEQN
jgi:hypothetical protein